MSRSRPEAGGGMVKGCKRGMLGLFASSACYVVVKCFILTFVLYGGVSGVSL